MARVLYKNVKTKAERDSAIKALKAAKLNPGYTDAGEFSKARKGTDVYAVARKKNVCGFKAKNVRMS